jgi:dipeptidase D
VSQAIEGLKPPLVWKYFAEIAKIPRCSKHEESIAAYVVATARRLGLTAVQDACGNVVARKPAAAGFERLPSICLQGHLDMVCEKNAGTVHDFSKDPIELVRKGNTLMANGTTLGADNGIAVATNLAIMEDRSLRHGPLEFLFTIDEETGLTGAANLDPKLITSRILLNLDSEEEGALYVGCSGGRDTLATWTLATEAAPAGTVAAVVGVKGLRGGHSGLEIDKGRGNAIKILARVLAVLSDDGARIAELRGGNKRNAIPRECTAVVAIPRKTWGAAVASVSRMNGVCRAELAGVDPDLSITLAELPGGKKRKVLKKPLQKKILMSIAALPHGVLRMSTDIPGLVETSTNVAVIDTTKKAVVIATSQRSSVGSELDEAVQTVQSVIELGGGKAEVSAGYPGWKPNLSSKILKTAKETYRQLYGKEAAIKAIHAGLECGILGERVPGMDMVSFGPTLEGVHSPDEKIQIDTVEKFWNLLLAILQNAR